MVNKPICAELWQPLSFIRQTMLENSFSYLPVRIIEELTTTWSVVSDVEVARYVRTVKGKEHRENRLLIPLAEAIRQGNFDLNERTLCHPEDSVRAAIQNSMGLPILVVRKDSSDLVGIVTAFDLL